MLLAIDACAEKCTLFKSKQAGSIKSQLELFFATIRSDFMQEVFFVKDIDIKLSMH